MRGQAFTWVITRPSIDTDIWLQKLEKYHFNTISFPCLEIIAQYPKTLDSRQVQQIAEAEMVIVTSPNSIRCLPANGLKALKKQEDKIITLGSGTSAVLKQHNIQPKFTGTRGFNSERLLASDFLQDHLIRQKKIVILSGQGGRELLEQQLKLRGALVQKLEIYQRCCPNVSGGVLFEKLQNKKPIFVITSQTALKNLLTIVPIERHTWLKQQVVVVVSQRIKIFAQAQGFCFVKNTASTNLEDIVNQFS